MTITVNGVAISEEQVQAEQAQYADAESPRDAAIQELILRELLEQQAKAQNIAGENPADRIGALLEQEVKTELVEEAACRDFYERYPERFVSGESAVANHILMPAGQDELSKSLSRAKAEGVLAEVQANPQRFGDLAREHSTCPSGQQGGSLGQFGRGQMVPEFEQAVFSTEAGQITPHLVETQFGFHVIQVVDREQGGKIGFDEIKDRLQQYLSHMAHNQAVQRYLAGLVAAAKIEGYAMPAL